MDPGTRLISQQGGIIAFTLLTIVPAAIRTSSITNLNNIFNWVFIEKQSRYLTMSANIGTRNT
jgi:hypothetical protein